MTATRLSAAVAFLLAAVGIGIQIAAGADYPVVPPGAIILVVAAAVCLLWRRWWALLPAAIALFLLVGGALAPNTADNLDAGGGRMWGTVLQLAAMVVALVVTVLAAVRERRTA
ncbi:hypothetical protein [Micromonospora chersina]|uniref:hypothetical protein n=1 Tax=Micromonospora chersina TaxID=47854 RepID=UPI00371935CC